MIIGYYSLNPLPFYSIIVVLIGVLIVVLIVVLIGVLIGVLIVTLIGILIGVLIGVLIVFVSLKVVKNQLLNVCYIFTSRHYN
jgi:hypothetical protein